MSVFYRYVKESLWKASKNLIRDFAELELLQSGSTANTEKFVQRSKSRTKDILSAELSKLNYKSLVFSDDPMPKIDGVHILINEIEGIENLQRAFRGYSISLIQLKIENKIPSVLACAIAFPSLMRAYYTENGQGAWVEKFDDDNSARLRSSGEKEISNCSFPYSFKSVSNKGKIYRDFGSISLEIVSFASGRFDAILVNDDEKFFKLAAKIFAKETGARLKELQSGDIIAHNSLLTF